MSGLTLALAGMPAIAAVGLPPLRVDPALLGGAPAPAKPAPDKSIAQPATPAPSPSAVPMSPASAAPAAAPTLLAPVAPVQEPSARAAEGPASAGMAPAQVGGVPRLPTTPFSRTDKTAAPTTVTADRIEGINEQEVVAEGNVLVERGGDTLRADRLVYRQLDDEVEATGNVRLTSPNTTMNGPRLKMRLEASTGEFEKPEYTIRHPRPPVPEPALTLLGLPAMDESGNVVVQSGRMLQRPPVTGSGSAAQLEFRGKDQYRLSEATFSTCAPGKRDWEIYVDTLDLDYVHEEGSGRHATVRFKDVPLLYLPWMNFSLNNQRKSGFLPPTVGSTSKSGFEVAAPWYWNIAPNMDATLTPRLMTRRGVQLNGEFRYLLDTEANRTQAGMPDKGQVRIEYLPGDRLAERDRYGFALIHTQTLGNGFSAALNLNGVSDDNYFSDLSTRVSQVSQGNLLRQGVLNYAGPWYAASLNLQGFQTLQNLAKPYQRLPQLTGSAFRYDLPFGLAFNLNAEYVNFDHPTNVLGKRTIVYPQLSWPLATSALSLTPKIGVHVTHYELAGLDRPAAAAWSAVPASQNRALPIFSLDGSAVLERNTDWFGKTLLQTLEPRAYYVFVPKRDQNQIPVFDSGIADFNFAQMFSENRYAGGDRIGDANELTLAVTSRLIDPRSGADLLRATVGTRHYFTDQSVTLPGEKARTDRAADILATLAGQIWPRTYADIGWQYNPRDGRTERLNLGGRYRPEAGKVLNVTYRYSRDLLGQIDVSAQWPLFGGWHGVGRYNYSTKERRVIETIGGLEYDAGCWVGRFVVQRLATIADQPTTALFFQLELNDFSRIGSNPLQLLRRSIPGYGVINQPTADPVFAEN
ncbi:MAG: LPS-assembly protein LptD [Pseudomonadota bacterium]